jgi:hypothetical protein
MGSPLNIQLWRHCAHIDPYQRLRLQIDDLEGKRARRIQEVAPAGAVKR